MWLFRDWAWFFFSTSCFTALIHIASTHTHTHTLPSSSPRSAPEVQSHVFSHLWLVCYFLVSGSFCIFLSHLSDSSDLGFCQSQCFRLVPDVFYLNVSLKGGRCFKPGQQWSHPLTVSFKHLNERSSLWLSLTHSVSIMLTSDSFCFIS